MLLDSCLFLRVYQAIINLMNETRLICRKSSPFQARLSFAQAISCAFFVRTICW